MRFDSAREAGLTEAQASLVTDDYPANFRERETAALALTDSIIGIPGALDTALVQQLKEQFSDAEIIELSLGVGLFMGMSKVLITLGLEPADDMPVTVLPTPGSV